MGALNPFAMWGALGLLGVAVPIIIHLLYRKNRKQTDWAAMELLRRALVVRSGQIKLEDFLVLLLRCLAMLLIAFALLRPILKSGASAFLGEKRTGMVVAIDASLSMGHGEHSRFEKALTKAQEVLASAREGDPITLVLLSERPKILVRGADYDPVRVRNLLETRAEPSSHRLGLDANIGLLAELAAELKAGSREVHLITDAQEADWKSITGPSRDTLDKLSEDATFFVFPIESGGEENLSVVRFEYASGPLQRSGVARFEAEVKNLGRRTSSGGSVEFSVGGQLVSRRAVGQLEAGKSAVLPMFARFDSPGDLELQASLSKDELNADNHRYAVVGVSDTIRVLCVDSQSAAGLGVNRRGAYYAVRALRLKSSGDQSPIDVTQVDTADLSREVFDDYEIILLANVPDVDPETVSRLRRFTERGGGLVVFAGDSIDPAIYAERFGSGEENLLPAEFGEVLAAPEGEDEAGWTIASPESDHPLPALLARLTEGVADSARIDRILSTKPAPGAQILLRVAANDEPLLLTRDVGAGAVLLFTTSADRAWNELPVHPLYSMLLQQAATTLTGRPDSRLFETGQLANVAIPGDGPAARLELTTPGGDKRGVFPAASGDASVVEIETDAPGIYRITDADGNPAAALAANFDPAESDVRILDPAALESNLDGLGTEIIAPNQSVASAIKSARRGSELSKLLLTLGVLCFIAQSILAKWFTNRISRGEADVAASLQLSQVAAARRS